MGFSGGFDGEAPRRFDAGAKLDGALAAPFEAPSKLGTSQGKPFETQGKPALRQRRKAGCWPHGLRAKPKKKQIPRYARDDNTVEPSNSAERFSTLPCPY